MELATLFRNGKIFENTDCVKRTGGIAGTATDESVPPVTHNPLPATPLSQASLFFTSLSSGIAVVRG